MMAKDYLMRSPTGYFYSKNHPLQTQFDARILELLAAGIPQRSYKREIWHFQAEPRQFYREAGERRREVVLGTEHTLPMFMLTGFGLSGALVSFATERALGRKC